MSDWDGIEEVVAVEDAGSFAAAATALGVSTSHISRAIARLEDRVQTQIFRRTTRRVAITDDGRVLIDQFRRIIHERNEALASIQVKGEPQGDLALTCATSLGERFVEPIVRRFALDYPKLNVSLDLTNRVIDLTAEGYDLAIRTGYLKDSRLIITRIASRTILTCASPSYIATHGVPETPEDLSNHACLIGTATTWRFVVNDEIMALRPRGRWQCNSGSTLVEAATDGMGICQLPHYYVARHVRDGRLLTLLEAYRPQDEPIWAVYPQQRHIQPKVRLLVERLRRELPSGLIGSVRELSGVTALAHPKSE